MQRRMEEGTTLRQLRPPFVEFKCDDVICCFGAKFSFRSRPALASNALKINLKRRSNCKHFLANFLRQEKWAIFVSTSKRYMLLSPHPHSLLWKVSANAHEQVYFCRFWWQMLWQLGHNLGQCQCADSAVATAERHQNKLAKQQPSPSGHFENDERHV